MLHLAFKVSTFIDQRLASFDERRRAALIAHQAVSACGDRAIEAVLGALRSEPRRRDRRTLRLAVARLVAGRHIVVPMAALKHAPPLA